MAKVFGKASDFYRARILTLREDLMADFDWREDILYRAAESSPDTIRTSYCLQVVTLDSHADQSIKRFGRRKEAEVALKAVEEDLLELTKMEFEDKYQLENIDVPAKSDFCLRREEQKDAEDDKDGNANAPRNLP